MTVSSTPRKAGPFAGNAATTSFPFAFKVYTKNDIGVVLTSSTGVVTTLVLDSDYSVTVGTTGGTVTYPISGSPLPVGSTLTIVGNMAYEQTTQLPTGGAYNAQNVEAAFDRQTILSQQLLEAVGRAVTAPVSAQVSAELPFPLANALIGWNAAADELQNVNPASLLTIAGSSGFVTQVFSGTGAQTVFTLSENPGSVNNLEVFVSGVRQTPGVDYTFSSTTLTFTVAPPSGSGNILTRWGQTLGIGVPSNNSVQTSSMVDDAVTTAKLANLNVTTEKMANAAVTFPKMQNIATSRLLGRASAGTGGVEELTGAQATALLVAASETVSGRVELADATEAAAGTDATRALSPARLRNALAASGAAPVFACRAWVNFNGTGTVAIRASGNVSSITDNGTGNYTVNFTTSMPDANYAITYGFDTDQDNVNQFATSSTPRSIYSQQSLKTTSNFRIFCGSNAAGGSAALDFRGIDISVFR
jgi:hypothetical protein